MRAGDDERMINYECPSTFVIVSNKLNARPPFQS